VRRRAYLAAGLATIAPLAGCTGGDEGGNESSTGNSDGGDEEPALRIVDHEVVEGGPTGLFLAVTVENGTESPTGWLTLDVEWLDEDGTVVGSDMTHLGTLDAGETWEARVHYTGDETGVEDYRIEGVADLERATAPEGLELLESAMGIDGDEVVVEGLVENATGADQPTVEAIAIVYDDGGTVLDDAWTSVSDLADGETWAFEATWRAFDRAEAAADHVVVLSDSAFG